MREVDPDEVTAWIRPHKHGWWTGIPTPPGMADVFVLHAIYRAPEPTDSDMEFPLEDETAEQLAARGWTRVRWTDLVPGAVYDHRLYPGPRWMPHPDDDELDGPLEGKADLPTYLGLLTVLERLAPQGPDTPIVAYWAPPCTNDWTAPTAREGSLGELVGAYDMERLSPSNFWAADRSWFVHTDYDAWGTRVAGSPELLNALRADDFLEVAPGLLDQSAD